jgi:hypothetical protein
MADQIGVGTKLAGVGAQKVVPLPATVPIVHASSISAYLAGNDFTLIFARMRPVMVEGIEDGAAAAMGEPVVVLQLSPGTLKDLSLACADQIAQYEKQFGVVQTEYTKKVAGKK